MDAAYRSIESRRWVPVELEIWRGSDISGQKAAAADYDDRYHLIKRELMPDGRTKTVLKDKTTGEIVQRTDPV
jgi:hypothetical protein